MLPDCMPIGGLKQKSNYTKLPVTGIQNKLGDRIKINYAQGYEKLSTFVEGSNKLDRIPEISKGEADLTKAVSGKRKPLRLLEIQILLLSMPD